jgi:secretion/DNA translocation related TadE-like protein
MTLRRYSDRGVATVWASSAVAVLIGVLAAALDLAGVVAGRHRAEAAADLAALAAVGAAPRGTAAACGRAADVASRTGGRLVLCRLQGWEAIVEVEATLRLSLVGTATVRGRARAGPGSTDAGERSTPMERTGAIAQITPSGRRAPPNGRFRQHRSGRARSIATPRQEGPEQRAHRGRSTDRRRFLA